MDITGLAAVTMPFIMVMYIVSVRTRTKRELMNGQSTLSAASQGALDQAQVQARRLEERIDHLERILDEDAPGWRSRVAG